MKLSWILFGLLMACCITVLYLFIFVDEVPDGHGFTHPQFETMQRGGDGSERHAPVLALGWLLGSLIIVFFVALLALGLRTKGVVGEKKWVFLGGAVLYLGVFAAMVAAYSRYAAADSHPLFLSFPIPGAWMIYGIWPIPLYFLVLYTVFFDRWVLKAEDLEKFRQIVDARRAQETE